MVKSVAIGLFPSNSNVFRNTLTVSVAELLGRISSFASKFRLRIYTVGLFKEWNIDQSTKINHLLTAANEDLKIGEVARALRKFDGVLRLQPHHLTGLYNRANALRDLGQINQAIRAFEKLIQISPTHSEAYRNLSSLNPGAQGAKWQAQLERLVSDPRISDTSRHHLLFAWGAIQEHRGNFKAAFDSFHRGNAMRKIAIGYHLGQDRSRFEKLKTLPSRVAKVPTTWASEIAHIPIFILGMPRTGSTLIEQMISQHPQIHASGELAEFTALALPSALRGAWFDENQMQSIRDRYSAYISSMRPNTKYVVDKMPHNFLVVPVILQAFPEAKIIHVVRNPEATCWSNFRHFFVADEMAYSHDLSDIVGYYNLYKSLICRFSADAPERLCHINYELLVENTEECMRRILEFLGLPWASSCLRPDRNARVARTASQLQVRQPVYSGSSNFWRNYEVQIGDAFEDLVESHPDFLNRLRLVGAVQSSL